MFLQTTPLYFSAWGSHFRAWLDTPWLHLMLQHDVLLARLAEVVSQDKFRELLHTYETLNRVSAPYLLDAARRAGFRIVREYITTSDYPIPPFLLDIYREDVQSSSAPQVAARGPRGGPQSAKGQENGPDGPNEASKGSLLGPIESCLFVGTRRLARPLRTSRTQGSPTRKSRRPSQRQSLLKHGSPN